MTPSPAAPDRARSDDGAATRTATEQVALERDELQGEEHPADPPTGIAGAWARISARPGVKHLLRAVNRFLERLGTQFAAAITYFSLLSVIPVIMVAFGITALVLRGNQGVLDELKGKVAEQIPGDLMSKAIDSAVDHGVAVGVIGLVIALYSGVGWIGNIREAVQAQWRPQFEKSEQEKAQSFLSFLLQNLVTLLSLGLAMLVSVALTTAGGAAQSVVLQVLGLDGVGWLRPVVAVVTFAVAIAADTVIFVWLFRRLAIEEFTPSRRTLVRGALIVAVAFEVLKVAMTFLIPLLTTSATSAAFGPVIVLLFFFNLVATVLLFAAAWIGTADDNPPDPQDLPEIPGPALVVPQAPAPRTKAGLLGVGTAVGFVLGRFRRRR